MHNHASTIINPTKRRAKKHESSVPSHPLDTMHILLAFFPRGADPLFWFGHLGFHGSTMFNRCSTMPGGHILGLGRHRTSASSPAGSLGPLRNARQELPLVPCPYHVHRDQVNIGQPTSIHWKIANICRPSISIVFISRAIF